MPDQHDDSQRAFPRDTPQDSQHHDFQHDAHRSRQHTLRLGILVVLAGLVTFLMILLIGPALR